MEPANAMPRRRMARACRWRALRLALATATVFAGFAAEGKAASYATTPLARRAVAVLGCLLTTGPATGRAAGDVQPEAEAEAPKRVLRDDEGEPGTLSWQPRMSEEAAAAVEAEGGLRNKFRAAVKEFKAMAAGVDAADKDAVDKAMSKNLPIFNIVLPALAQDCGTQGSSVMVESFYDNLDDFTTRMYFGSWKPVSRSYKKMILNLDLFETSLTDKGRCAASL